MLYSEAKAVRAEIMRLDRNPNSGARVMSRNAMRGINNHIAAVAYALGGRQNVAADFSIPDNSAATLRRALGKARIAAQA